MTDWAAVDAQIGGVNRWLDEVRDLLDAIAVAGLAWPDPDLSRDLKALAGLSRELQAEGGACAMEALAECVEKVRDAPHERRPPRAREATAALHALLAWYAAMRAEVDGMAVQGALVTHGRSEQAPQSVSGFDGEVWPVGAELHGDRLLIHGRVLPGGAPVLLVDTLLEVGAADPAHSHVISRLFQERVQLAAVLHAVLCFTSHPMRRQAGVVVVQPDFERRPVGRPVTDAVGMPQAPETEGELPEESGAVRAPITLGRDAQGLVLRVGERALSLPPDGCLPWTLSKLGLNQGVVTWPGVVRARRGQLSLLAVHPPQGPTCHPQLDTRAFPLDLEALAARVADRADADALWLRAVCARFTGGAGPGLLADLGRAEPSGASDSLRLARAYVALGMEIPSSLCAVLVQEAGQRGALGTTLLGALWVAFNRDEVERYRAALEVVWERHLAAPPSDPDPITAGARALYIALLEIPFVSEDGSMRTEATERATTYLDAHLGSLRLAARGRSPRLPALQQLAWVCEVRLLVTGDFAMAPMDALDLPVPLLREALTEGLWAVTVDAPAVAGDALWLTGLLGWRALL